MAGYEILDHTADTGIEATADSLPSLIETLASGMFSLVATVGDDAPDRVVEFAVSAPDPADLAYEALSELLYHSDVENLVFSEFAARLVDPSTIYVVARGVDASGIELIGPPIKAVTYHQLEIRETGDGWRGKVYFDV